MFKPSYFALGIIGIAMASTHFYASEPFPEIGALKSQVDFPNPIVTLNGKAISDQKSWETERKLELRKLFEHYMYGKLPEKPSNHSVKLLYSNKQAFNGKVSLAEYEIQFDLNGSKNPAPIRLLLALPPNAKKAPCFIGLMFCGNHAIVPDEGIRLPDNWQYDKQPGVVKNKASDSGRGKQMDVWPIETICSKGYGLAAFYAGDIQPDRPNIDEALRKALGKTDTATVMSWAWGVHRVVDFLETIPEVDANRLAVVGHSRLGKAALVAGAFDDRIAVVIPNQAGCGGTGPSRHNDPKAEGVKRINTSFPHWFCDNFKQFNDDTTKLPFDQNGLVALCAPRPVLFTNAEEDLWANPSGQFKILKAAEPAYKLYNVEGCRVSEMPKNNELIDSRLGYFIRPGKHAMTMTDWNAYLTFADKWLKK